jgi:hypothetical protein
MNLKQRLISWPTLIASAFIAVSAYALNDGPIPYQSKQSIPSQATVAVPIQLVKGEFNVGVLPIRNPNAASYPPTGGLTCLMNNIQTQKIVGADLANVYNLCRFHITVDKTDTFLLMIRNGTDSGYFYEITVLER